MGLTSLIGTNTIRDILIHNNLLKVIRKLLGDTPNYSVSKKGDDEYCTHRYLFMTVQYVIRYSRESELHVRINDTNTYAVVDELKALYCKSELWSMSIWMGVFFQLWWEETPAEKVTWKMYKIHGHLVYNLDY